MVFILNTKDDLEIFSSKIDWENFDKIFKQTPGFKFSISCANYYTIIRKHIKFTTREHKVDESGGVVFDENEPSKITSPNNEIEIEFNKLTLNEGKVRESQKWLWRLQALELKVITWGYVKHYSRPR